MAQPVGEGSLVLVRNKCYTPYRTDKLLSEPEFSELKNKQNSVNSTNSKNSGSDTSPSNRKKHCHSSGTHSNKGDPQ